MLQFPYNTPNFASERHIKQDATMKHLFSLLLAGMATIGASAQSYNYFTFKTTDGTETSVGAENLKITFQDNKLVATNGTESFTAAVGDMATMFFALTPTSINETAENGSVSATITDGKLRVNAPAGTKVTVYGVDGRQYGTTGLQKGTYLVRIGNQTLKVVGK